VGRVRVFFFHAVVAPKKKTLTPTLSREKRERE